MISTSACRSGPRSWCCRRARSSVGALSRHGFAWRSYRRNFFQHRPVRCGCGGTMEPRCAERKGVAAVVQASEDELWNRKGRQMRSRVALISTAILLAGTLAAAAQQRLPQEPRGEDSSRSSTPSNQQPGPDGPDSTVGRGGATAPGTTGPGGQSTPQEPRGEDSSRSTRPSNQQLPPNPNERR